MAEGYTVFFTYMLGSETSDSFGYGYSRSIHCNYINSLQLDDILNKEVNIYFNKPEDFKFLSSGNTGTGFTASRIFLLIQVVDNTQFNTIYDVIPIASEWRKYDATGQIGLVYPEFITGELLNDVYLSTTVFKAPLNSYNDIQLMPKYTLDYLNYPSIEQSELIGASAPLCFGDENYFFGTVTTDVEAVAYTTDISIELLSTEFNSTNNETWNGSEDVYITEVGIYDNNKNLVAIGKLNNPIQKNSTISRTILFSLDF